MPLSIRHPTTRLRDRRYVPALIAAALVLGLSNAGAGVEARAASASIAAGQRPIGRPGGTWPLLQVPHALQDGLLLRR